MLPAGTGRLTSHDTAAPAAVSHSDRDDPTAVAASEASGRSDPRGPTVYLYGIETMSLVNMLSNAGDERLKIEPGAKPLMYSVLDTVVPILAPSDTRRRST